MKSTQKKLLIFTSLCLIFGWAIMTCYVLYKNQLPIMSLAIFRVSFQYVPFAVAVFLQRGIYKLPIQGTLGILFRWGPWFWIASLVPFFVVAFSGFFSSLMPNVHINPQASFLVIIAGILIAFPIGMLFGSLISFGDEVGWRGFAFGQLAANSFWFATLVVGLLRGLYQLPLLFYGIEVTQNIFWDLIILFVFNIILAFPLNYFRLRANSVIATSLFMGVYSGLVFFQSPTFMMGNPYLIGPGSISSILALLILSIPIVLYDYFVPQYKILFPKKAKTNG